MNIERPKLATVTQEGHGEYDWLLQEFVAELKAAGVNVQGLLTKHYKNPMIIYDVSTEQEFTISQCLGSLSSGCSLDLGKMAEAAFVLRKALDEQADLVVLNRFGTSEAEGEGFMNELQALVSQDIAVLTMTDYKYLADWRRFTGGLAQELAPNKEALYQWFDDVVRKDNG